MFYYGNPDDPNHDPYWGEEQASSSEATTYPALSDLELEELVEGQIQELREEGVL